jgi:V8-like Glu-specific endopeptidase
MTPVLAVTGRRRWLLASLSGLAVGCADPSPPRLGLARDAVIYGYDSRRDVYAVDRPELVRLALDSMVAFMSAEHLVENADGTVAITADTLAASNNLCPGEAFASQPAAATCSGVLVDDQLVLTAGHCIPDDATCDDERLVFGYAVTAPAGGIALDSEAIYRCKSIPLRRHIVDAEGRRWDYGFIELDRPVGAARHPVTIASEPPSIGSPLTVIGTPSGLPVKVDDGARLLYARSCMDYFTLDSDTFESSSGSGVFDELGRLAGVFVRGGGDYQFDPDRNCAVARRIPEVVDPAGAEQASYLGPAIAALCAAGWPSARLCSATAPLGAAPQAGAVSCTSGGPVEPSGGCAIGADAGSRPANGFAATLVAIALVIGRSHRRRWLTTQ